METRFLIRTPALTEVLIRNSARREDTCRQESNPETGNKQDWLKMFLVLNDTI